MPGATQVPIAEEMLILSNDGPRLLGGRCTACGTVSFPRWEACARCTNEEIAPEVLSPRGTLWTWTVQGFPPKAPPYTGPTDERFEPFAVGYVELPGQVKVETRIVANEPVAVCIGAEMELVLLPVAVDDEGNEVVTFAFAPVHEEVRP